MATKFEEMAVVVSQKGKYNERFLYYFQKSVDRDLVIPGNMFTARTKRLFEKVTATDKEDGILENEIDVTIPEMNQYDFVNLPELRITYQAKDRFGNITEKSVMVYIVKIP